ncbi:hypothetical protein Pla110_20710 [Polystyrenella longa]|uniref:Uncharacterized protein n=1 Tax=Polystyrenella longa TaxID=2528007 RepID=A0A518CMD6_9PLAN|nr:hypothetical protein Pla110_20710 [Polystyrenella longa]
MRNGGVEGMRCWLDRMPRMLRLAAPVLLPQRGVKTTSLADHNYSDSRYRWARKVIIASNLIAAFKSSNRSRSKYATLQKYIRLESLFFNVG